MNADHILVNVINLLHTENFITRLNTLKVFLTVEKDGAAFEPAITDKAGREVSRGGQEAKTSVEVSKAAIATKACGEVLKESNAAISAETSLKLSKGVIEAKTSSDVYKAANPSKANKEVEKEALKAKTGSKVSKAAISANASEGVSKENLSTMKINNEVSKEASTAETSREVSKEALKAKTSGEVTKEDIAVKVSEKVPKEVLTAKTRSGVTKASWDVSKVAIPTKAIKVVAKEALTASDDTSKKAVKAKTSSELYKEALTAQLRKTEVTAKVQKRVLPNKSQIRETIVKEPQTLTATTPEVGPRHMATNHNKSEESVGTTTSGANGKIHGRVSTLRRRSAEDITKKVKDVASCATNAEKVAQTHSQIIQPVENNKNASYTSTSSTKESGNKENQVVTKTLANNPRAAPASSKLESSVSPRKIVVFKALNTRELVKNNSSVKVKFVARKHLDLSRIAKAEVVKEQTLSRYITVKERRY